MIEEQVREIVTSAIATACPQPLGCYHLCWWQDQIQCLPMHHTTKAHRVFVTMVGHTLTAGLSPRGWHVLTNRIIQFCGNADLTLNGLAVNRGHTLENRSGKRTGSRRRCSLKTRARVNKRWSRVWTGPAPCRPW